jgi:high affinity Mn2+ porin
MNNLMSSFAAGAIFLALATPVPAEESDSTAAAATGESAHESEDWSVHGQYTLTYQVKPGFPSSYQSANSLTDKFQARASNTATAFLGTRLWQGAEAYFDPEISEGFGLSHTFGLAGFSNGEAQKGGSTYPKIYPARYYLKQVIGLGDAQEWIDGGPNQLAGSQDISRLTILAGGVAATDFFQTNGYAGDPRANFTNWALWESAAWDVAGDNRGYTRGVLVELNQEDWAIRYGAFDMPRVLNGTDVFSHSDQTISHNLELEGRYALADRPGKARLLGYYNLAPMGNYRDALQLAAKGLDINAAMQQTRTDGHEKFGFAISLEQEIADALGAFARLSWNNGRNEEWGFTDADSSAAAGVSLKGTYWGRPDDTVGIGAAVNAITQAHRQFLAAGGDTLLLGDGALNYGEETDLEAFYAAKLTEFLTLTGDYQFIVNPGYNQVRGPVHIFGARLHAEF